jgi:hypothetical protein
VKEKLDFSMVSKQQDTASALMCTHNIQIVNVNIAIKKGMHVYVNLLLRSAHREILGATVL